MVAAYELLGRRLLTHLHRPCALVSEHTQDKKLTLHQMRDLGISTV